MGLMKRLILWSAHHFFNIIRKIGKVYINNIAVEYHRHLKKAMKGIDNPPIFNRFSDKYLAEFEEQLIKTLEFLGLRNNELLRENRIRFMGAFYERLSCSELDLPELFDFLSLVPVRETRSAGKADFQKKENPFLLYLLIYM